MTSINSYRHPSAFNQVIKLMFHFKIVIIIAIALLGTMYIAEANVVSSHSIKIKALQRDISNMQRENQQFEIQVASSQSMSTVESRIQALNLVPTEHLIYLNIPGAAVAMR